MPEQNTESEIIPNRFVKRWSSSSIDGYQVTLAFENLQNQISKTFPESGLIHTLEDLTSASKEATAISEKKSVVWKLSWPVAILIPTIVFVSVLWLFFDKNAPINGFDDVDGVLNLIFLCVMIGYLIRQAFKSVRRISAMKQLHKIRSLIHMLDMKQQNKKYHNKCLTNKRPLTTSQNIMYLDDCSQALSLAGKIAALLIEGHNDTIVIATVNEIDSLCNGISAKIWQKISVLQNHVNEE